MKKILAAIALCFLFAASAHAGGGLDSFLRNLNVEARGDMNGFTARISAKFGVPEIEVRAVLGKVRQPADVFMVFQLGHMTRKPTDTVLHTYKRNQGRGWGVIAKQLGIKPGSREFHALKRGDFRLEGGPNAGPGNGKGRGKGHDK